MMLRLLSWMAWSVRAVKSFTPFFKRWRSWKAWRVPLLLILFLSLALPLPTHSDTVECPGQARLNVGGVARIAFAEVYEPSLSYSLRDFPGTEAQTIGDAAPGAALAVLRGPICVRNVRWWQVRTLSGEPLTGWAAETQGEAYALEPWQTLVDVPRLMPDGIDVLRINAQGLGRKLTHYPVASLADGGLSAFPAAEATPLQQAFTAAQRACPNLAHWLDVPDTERLAAYPSPDSTRLLLVRHLWRAAVGCDGTSTPRYGIDRLSLLEPDGEHILFDVPARAALTDLPAARDASTSAAASDPPNRVMGVFWSPDNVHALAWLRYGTRARLLLIDARNGSLRVLDDGAAPAWSFDGTHLAWLRTDGSATNLISAAPDNADRLTLILPGTLQYTDAPLVPTWNAAGTQFLACFQADNCRSVGVIDVSARRMLPLTVPVPQPAIARWLDDQTLLWLPGSGNVQPNTLVVMPIPAAGSIATPPHTLTLPMIAGSAASVIDALPFPGSSSVLLEMQATDGTLRYAVLDLQSGDLNTVRFMDSS